MPRGLRAVRTGQDRHPASREQPIAKQVRAEQTGRTGYQGIGHIGSHGSGVTLRVHPFFGDHPYHTRIDCFSWSLKSDFAGWIDHSMNVAAHIGIFHRTIPLERIGKSGIFPIVGSLAARRLSIRCRVREMHHKM